MSDDVYLSEGGERFRDKALYKTAFTLLYIDVEHLTLEQTQYKIVHSVNCACAMT